MSDRSNQGVSNNDADSSNETNSSSNGATGSTNEATGSTSGTSRHDDFEDKQNRGTKMQEMIEQGSRSQDGSRIEPIAPVTEIKLPVGKTWKRLSRPHEVPKSFVDEATYLGVNSEEKDWRTFLFLDRENTSETSTPHFEIKDQFVAVFGPRVMFIQNMKRTEGPFVSHVACRLWQCMYELEDLKHVFMLDVCHRDTRVFVQEQLYGEKTELSWPDSTKHEWMRDTPAYHALLGTALGRVVGFMLLTAFGSGKYRIARVATWASDENKLQMRFDIEEIPQEVTQEASGGGAISRFAKWAFRR